LELNEDSDWDYPPKSDPEVIERTISFVKDLDALIVCHGSPRLTDEILSRTPRLSFIGELEGDRFSQRIDLASAKKYKVIVVDTTHGSSYPVSEWALALILIGLRNGGAHFRRLSSNLEWGNSLQRNSESIFQWNEELTSKSIGLIGGGHIARRLIEFLRPFNVSIYVYDPYLGTDVATSLNFTLTSLDNVLSIPDIVVCLAPLTPSTKGMLQVQQINLMKPQTVFVNVSRGPIVNSQDLINRLKKNDMVACLDVFDPEPIPIDSEIRTLDNVFLSPHIAGTTEKSRTRFFTEMLKELNRHFSGHKTLHDITEMTIANRSGRPL
tara:strand:+ start:1605 stop:2576 length:972 start_codon:yes stop_codon:yes gene_type:complete